MAAQLEEELGESSQLVKSKGGVFDVEDRGNLIFSKHEVHRFPGEAEVLEIVRAVDEEGLSLAEARSRAAQNIPESISFVDWLKNLWHRRQSENG